MESFWNGTVGNVVVGLIGAAIVAALTYGLTRIRDAVIDRQFPVAGMYRSTFEDTVDGVAVHTKAIATLKQRGRKVWGPTTVINGERTWILDGRIAAGGRIHGRYTADGPHDEGLGGFFLELLSDGHLEGMWTGYDTENKLVSAGRYSFWPMMAMPIRRMATTDLDGTLSVLGNALGSRYVSRAELATYVGRNDRIAFVATGKDDQVYGAATSDLPAGASSVLELLPTDAQTRVLALIPELEFNRTGLLRSVAVSPKARGNSVGTSLVRASVEALWDMGATSILSIGWTDIDGCHIQGPLEAMGFAVQGDLEDFWGADSISKNYQCPTCGQPCSCTARIFLLSRV
ncbi:hypothetical protein GY21_18745 [Cryobacterium roopkundense]|uniref:Ribosomal protein S18 acetylase RimI-like enzyme n=1 Tax=Cryobacterium roopkundense TaxID=1001240 RepID=A0A099J3C0_9MICO|nr:GNAT family N-acetyltransferase [Cryobacterium roopkundense]KGJ71938.1 hypothetical protein GY21_18745 [Cryobacterium roopkundense]MBB5640964.1 ribosomal protein S18 acetylase RimI-like enzyme [Cryobacterium roopkundense]